MLPWLRQPLAHAKTRSSQSFDYTMANPEDTGCRHFVNLVPLFFIHWRSKCRVQETIILAWLLPCVIGKPSCLTCWQEMYQGLLCRNMLPVVDHWLNNEKETHWPLNLEKLTTFYCKCAWNTLQKNVSLSDFFGRNITILTSARNPTKINETIHFKSLLMWEHVYFTGTSGKSPLLPTKDLSTLQGFIALKLRLKHAYLYIPVITVCVLSIASYILETLSGLIAVCQRDVNWSSKSLCA